MKTSTINFNRYDFNYLNTSNFFGEVRKTIISKDFKGGEVTNVFGETVLDFTNADISGVVLLDISLAFGEVNITVPSSWRVETDLSQFLATTRDKRSAETDSCQADKTLVLVGKSVFGAVQVYTNQ
jgi:predicted membrane protein